MRKKNKKIKVLIVDDEADIREILGRIFKERGFIIEGAASGREALEKIAQDRPDIIILDVAMPEMDGLETCKRLRENPDTQNIPVIFLSAQAGIARALQGVPGATIEYIEKPCDIEYLFQRISDLAA